MSGFERISSRRGDMIHVREKPLDEISSDDDDDDDVSVAAPVAAPVARQAKLGMIPAVREKPLDEISSDDDDVSVAAPVAKPAKKSVSFADMVNAPTRERGSGGLTRPPPSSRTRQACAKREAGQVAAGQPEGKAKRQKVGDPSAQIDLTVRTKGKAQGTDGGRARHEQMLVKEPNPVLAPLKGGEKLPAEMKKATAWALLVSLKLRYHLIAPTGGCWWMSVQASLTAQKFNLAAYSLADGTELPGLDKELVPVGTTTKGLITKFSRKNVVGGDYPDDYMNETYWNHEHEQAWRTFTVEMDPPFYQKEDEDLEKRETTILTVPTEERLGGYGGSQEFARFANKFGINIVVVQMIHPWAMERENDSNAFLCYSPELKYEWSEYPGVQMSASRLHTFLLGTSRTTAFVVTSIGYDSGHWDVLLPDENMPEVAFPAASAASASSSDE